jgi:hypothetical protein
MRILLTICLSFLSIAAFAQADLTFEEYNPKSTLVVPGNEISKAKFPFIDIHSHQYRMGSQDLSELIDDMDQLNMGIMINLSGGSGDRLNQAINNANDHYPNRFGVFANVSFDGVGNEGWGTSAANQLEEDVKNGAKGLKIYKSLGLRNKDTDGKGWQLMIHV